MDINMLALSDIRRLTKPSSSGRMRNRHVVAHSKTAGPDFERMKQLAHPATTAKEPDAKTSKR